MTGGTVCVHSFETAAVAGGAIAASGEVLVIGAIGLDQAAFRIMAVKAREVYSRIGFIDQRRRITVAAGAAGRIDLDQGVMVRRIG